MAINREITYGVPQKVGKTMGPHAVGNLPDAVKERFPSTRHELDPLDSKEIPRPVPGFTSNKSVFGPEVKH